MRYAFLLLAAAAIATPALAQNAGADERTNTGPFTDSIIIGVGAASVPRYEGSSDNTIIPAAAAHGTIGGYGFTIAGTTLSTDIIPYRNATGGKFVLGPVAHLTLNRNSGKRTRDAQIRALGNIDAAVEVGGQVGFTQTGVITSDYDVFSATVSAVYDVTGTHDSVIVTPSISYGTPLSKQIFVGVNAAADYVGGKYARTYFGVTPAQSITSGLRPYSPGDGFKDISATALVNVSLAGDLRKGLSLFGVASYERLLGDFGRSPVTQDRTQMIYAAGLAYTF
ncbi:MAG: MipA/OmpV family protein [Sphingomonadales bacterium]|jgi:outer membrane scaffolding protein for murein synthesis (MipA/OmpV family)|nr:MipA/OmpV family protein [Sphingomonadales bacterium]